MLAAKEKTLSPPSPTTFTWSPRGTYVQAAATQKHQRTTTMHDLRPVVKRFTENDFRACKSEKSPIGSTVEIQFTSLIQNPLRPRKNTRSNRLQLRRSHRAIDMSQYRAYFVPGGVDPTGQTNVTVNAAPPWGRIQGECGESVFPTYSFGLTDPSKNTEGGYFVQKLSIYCSLAQCCDEDDRSLGIEKVAEIYEVFPNFIKPGKDVGQNSLGDRVEVDGNAVPIREGFEGLKILAVEVRFVTSEKLKRERNNGTLKKFVWYGPENSPCSSSPQGMFSTGYPSWSEPGFEAYTEEEVGKGYVPQWWTESEAGAKRTLQVGYSCCKHKEKHVAAGHSEGLINLFGHVWD